MPKKSDDTVYILEGTAVLFKRPLTPHWQVRFKAKNKWQRVTTKTEDLDEAKKKAVEIVQEALSKSRRRGKVLLVKGQPEDHPFPMALAEMRYLKFVYLQAFKD